MDPAPFISFVVIAYNEERGIANTLASVMEQRFDGRREVIVVDDGSEDETPAVVRRVAEDRPEVQLVRFPENRGRGAARHAGLRTAAGDYIAFVDADIILPPDWLDRCLQAIADADVVGGVAVPDGDVAYAYRRFGLTPKIVDATTTITGNNGLYRRRAFEHAVFDATLREGEDVALNHALEQADARLVTIPDLLVRHEEHKTFAGSLRWLYDSGRGATRQFFTYRQIRLPDLVFAGWIATCVTVLAARRRHRRAAIAPPAYLFLAATAHTSRSFQWERGRATRMLAATLVDACLLGAYFIGRLRGTLDLRGTRLVRGQAARPRRPMADWCTASVDSVNETGCSCRAFRSRSL